MQGQQCKAGVVSGKPLIIQEFVCSSVILWVKKQTLTHECCSSLDLSVTKGKSGVTNTLLERLPHIALKLFESAISMEIVMTSSGSPQEAFVEELATKYDHLIQKHLLLL